MTQTFTCPSCAAPLDYDGRGASTIECPYCSSSVIVPQELRFQRSEPVDQHVTMSLKGQAANLRELSRLVKTGQKVQAYNLYQQVFKVSLADAMRAVDQLSAGGAVVITSNIAAPGSYASPSSPVSTSPVNYSTTPVVVTSNFVGVRPQRPVWLWIIIGFIAFSVCMSIVTGVIPFIFAILGVLAELLVK